MNLTDRQRELICEIFMYYFSNMEELNTKLYPLDDPILVRPEAHELSEIMRLMLGDMKQEKQS